MAGVPDFTTLPLVLRSGQPGDAVPQLVSGVVIGGLGLILWFVHGIRVISICLMAVAAIFLWLPIAVRRTVRIDASTVAVRDRPLVGRSTDWRLPVSAFNGVRLRHFDSGERSVFTVLLAHDDEKWTVSLLETSDQAVARRVWRQAAEALRLPAVEPAPSQMPGLQKTPGPTGPASLTGRNDKDRFGGE